MSNESDGQHSQSGNIDTIKELLRKLEEVAVRDPAGPEPPREIVPLRAASEPVAPSEIGSNGPAPASDTLLALQRGRSLKASGEASSPRAIVIDTVATASSPSVKNALAEHAVEKSPKRGFAIAAGSFVLGVAAAGALILAYQPVSQLIRGPAPADTATIAQNSPPPSADQAARPAPVAEVAKTEAPSSSPAPGAPASAPADRSAPAAEKETAPPSAPTQTHTATPTPTAPSNVDRVADAIYRIETPERVDLRAGERRPIDVNVSPVATESARLLIVLRNIPAWLSLSRGGAVGKEIWLLPAHQASDVTIEAAEGANGNADIKVQLASIDGRILAERSLTIRATGFPASNAPMVASAPTGSDQMIQRLQARGELLLDTGEVEAARTLFRTAAEAGSVTAALRLAETYDPGEIQRFGMMETAADPALAVRWYEHAQALGSPVATARLAILGRR